MKSLKCLSKPLMFSVAFLAVLLVGCKGGYGGGDPILGGGDYAQLPPRVIAVTPQNNATQVPINNPIITATFNVAVAPIEGAASFTVTCESPGVNPTGTIALDVTQTIATYSLTPATSLAPNTVYTATVTGVRSLDTGIPMVGSRVWRFTTGATPDLVRPRVTLTVPATTNPGPTLGIPINTAITAAFTENMAPATINSASFTVTGPGGAALAGAVTYASRTAIFTPTSPLTSATTYTVTISTAAMDLASNALGGNQAALPAASNYVWTFTTGVAPDISRPRVTLTVPATTIPGPTGGVPFNTAIAAAFTEAMNPATLNGTSFTVTGPGSTAVAGVVSYASGSALFTPEDTLASGTTYTATISTQAEDLAGNALAGNQAALPAASAYIWSFTTAPPADSTAPTVTLTVPAEDDIDVEINASIHATFSEAMDPLTINTITFTVQASGPPLGPALPGAVTYDALTRIATFSPSSNLAVSTSYTATITDAKDLAGNTLATGLVPNPWTFTTGSGLAPGAVFLGSAGSFGIMATAAVTNTGFSIINGDVSLDPGTSMTGFPPGVVNGAIHINDTVSAQARADLLIAYNFAKTLPPGTTISAGADLGALYPLGIPPGTYTSGSTMLVSTPLVLDAGGNANAVWVFQIGSSLTTGASVSLANGAQAKNVFWVPTLDATIGIGTIFYGTIVSGRDVSGVTGATVNGRILAGATTAGTIALDTNTVNVPAP